MKPIHVAIIGRPNVGKSTLFNRLVGKKKALVHDLPGVTRDRNEFKTEWWYHQKAYPVLIVDTGGLGGDFFSDEIGRQVDIALTEADVALVVFDSQEGFTESDRDLILKLRQSGVEKKMPVIGIVNKVDAESHEEKINEFFEAGLDPLLTVSAEHSRGIDDLKEQVILALPDAEFSSESTEKEEVRIPRVAIVGRPNVGKSTFVNAVLGKERMITSPVAGTTVDAVDSLSEISGKPFILVDTAGIRRKSKTEQGVEVLSVVQARKALERANIAVLMLDAIDGVTDQDEKIGGLIVEAGCSVVLAINKWDAHKKNQKFTQEMAAERVRKQMAYLSYAPIVFLSALEGKGLDDLGDLFEEILEQRRLKISTKEFTEWVRKESTIHNPANAKFYLCHQTSRNPPTFVCHVNDPDKIHFSLSRHLVNAIRARWGFMGTPLKLLFVQGSGGSMKKPNGKKLKNK